MKKIFLDTNFILDYFIRDDYKSSSERLLVLGRNSGFKFYISYLSVANIAYIMRKLEQKELYGLLLDILAAFNVISNSSSQIKDAMNHCASDFEDALQYEAAIDSRCDCIITRNKKDFYFADLPVYTADEFVMQFFS